MGGDKAATAHKGRDGTENNASPNGTHGVGARPGPLLEVSLHEVDPVIHTESEDESDSRDIKEVEP